MVREPNIICSSTTPGLPYARATAAEHVDMILIVHEGDPALTEDLAAAREQIHPATMAAEGPLHDLGANLDHQQRLARDGADWAETVTARGSSLT